MHQSEPERDEPRLALAERFTAPAAIDRFSAEQGDTHCDDDLNGRSGQCDAAQRGGGERDGMSKGEGGDGGEQLAWANQQDQAEHEQEMIIAKDDVLDSNPEIGRCRRAGRGGQV